MIARFEHTPAGEAIQHIIDGLPDDATRETKVTLTLGAVQAALQHLEHLERWTPHGVSEAEATALLTETLQKAITRVDHGDPAWSIIGDLMNELREYKPTELGWR